jgi:hypothetical protein
MPSIFVVVSLCALLNCLALRGLRLCTKHFFLQMRPEALLVSPFSCAVNELEPRYSHLFLAKRGNFARRRGRCGQTVVRKGFQVGCEQYLKIVISTFPPLWYSTRASPNAPSRHSRPIHSGTFHLWHRITLVTLPAWSQRYPESRSVSSQFGERVYRQE